MKSKTSILFISFFFCYSIVAQQKEVQFVAPDSIPINVTEYVRKMLYEMVDSNYGSNITASIRVSDNKIYKIDFLPLNTVKYFNAEKAVEINNPDINNALALSLGTQNMPLGWFDDLENFGPPFEQPFYDIYLGTTSSYITQITHKNVDWGYSSHIFEPSTWIDCYGKYTMTTQNVRLFINKKILNTIYFYGSDFTNMEYNYYGRYFEGTNVPVNNNATEFQVTFRIDFEPSYITGPDVLCSNQQAEFILHNNSYPVDSIVWSKSDNLSYISGQGTENYFIKALGSGNAWVKAKLITSCGEVLLDAKNITIGKPVISSNSPLAYFNGFTYNNVCNQQTISTNMTVLNAPAATWTRIAANPSNTTWYQSGNNISFYFYNINQTAVYRIMATNTCGTTSYDFGFKSISCGVDPCNPLYVVSPNPASNSVVIIPNIPAPCDNSLEMASANIDGKITVYDKLGTVKKQKLYKYNNQVEIDVQDLSNGIYFIEIFDGFSTVKKTIIVQH